MRSDRVHHDGERQDMAAHDENQEEDLGRAEHLSPDFPGHDFACVGHVVDAGVGELELANYIAGVRCDDAEAYD